MTDRVMGTEHQERDSVPFSLLEMILLEKQY